MELLHDRRGRMGWSKSPSSIPSETSFLTFCSPNLTIAQGTSSDHEQTRRVRLLGGWERQDQMGRMWVCHA